MIKSLSNWSRRKSTLWRTRSRAGLFKVSQEQRCKHSHSRRTISCQANSFSLELSQQLPWLDWRTIWFKSTRVFTALNWKTLPTNVFLSTTSTWEEWSQSLINSFSSTMQKTKPKVKLKKNCLKSSNWDTRMTHQEDLLRSLSKDHQAVEELHSVSKLLLNSG